jgi:hypothetical protein
MEMTVSEAVNKIDAFIKESFDGDTSLQLIASALGVVSIAMAITDGADKEGYLGSVSEAWDEIGKQLEESDDGL